MVRPSARVMVLGGALALLAAAAVAGLVRGSSAEVNCVELVEALEPHALGPVQLSLGFASNGHPVGFLTWEHRNRDHISASAPGEVSHIELHVLLEGPDADGATDMRLVAPHGVPINVEEHGCSAAERRCWLRVSSLPQWKEADATLLLPGLYALQVARGGPSDVRTSLLLVDDPATPLTNP
ncbi:MAG: hypothetical protein AB2A00_28355 [Myxococcota bacterium]